MKLVGERVKRWFDQFGYECGGSKGGYGDGVFLAERSHVRFEFIDVQYGPLAPTSVTPVVLEQRLYVNNGSLPSRQYFKVGKKTTSTFTYVFEDIRGIGISARTAIPFFAEGGAEILLALGNTHPQTTIVEQGWANSTSVQVGPHKKVVTSFIVNEASYRIPFTARVRARGAVRMAYPGRYPTARGDVTYWDAEIDDMLTQWGPEFFEFDLPGTLNAVHGVNYEVRVDEYDLIPRGAAPKALPWVKTMEEPARTKVIDAGQMVNRAPRSALRQITAAVRRAENVPA